MNNNLLIEQNSGFKPKDSTVNQLLRLYIKYIRISIMVKILVSFSLMYQMLLIRCGIKFFFFKLSQLGIVDTLYDWIEHYFTDRSQKDVVNGISFSLRYLQTIGWPKLTNRRTSHRLVLFYKIFNDLTPQYLKTLM